MARACRWASASRRSASMDSRWAARRKRRGPAPTHPHRPLSRTYSMTRRKFVASIAALGGLFAVHRSAQSASKARDKEWDLSDEQWRKRLTPEQFHVLREEGTERAGSSALNAEKRKGTFA